MTRVRVLVVNDRSLAAGWGAEIYARRLVEGLRAAGDDVDVVAGEITHQGVRKLLDVWDPAARRLVAARAAALRADVVHHHNVLREMSPSVLGVPAGVPSVLTVHDLRLVGARDHNRGDPRAAAAVVKSRLDALLVRHRTRAVVAVSEPVADALRAAGFPDVRVVGVPVEPPTRPPQPLVDCTDIVFAGRLSPDKGVDVLIDAFAMLTTGHPDATLVIAGDGPEAARLRLQAAPLGPRVRFVGRLDAEDLSDLLGRARGVVVPSVPQRRREGSSLAVAEAAMHGRPVIGSDDPAVAAMVERLGCGRTVPAGAPSALAEAVEALLRDENEAERFGAAGAAAVVRLHSVPAVTAAMRAVYADVAGSER